MGGIAFDGGWVSYHKCSVPKNTRNYPKTPENYPKTPENYPKALDPLLPFSENGKILCSQIFHQKTTFAASMSDLTFLQNFWKKKWFLDILKMSKSSDRRSRVFQKKKEKAFCRGDPYISLKRIVIFVYFHKESIYGV